MKYIILMFLFTSLGWASFDEASNTFLKRMSSSKKNEQIAVELSNSGYPYASVSWFKEVIINKSKQSSSVVKTLNNVINKVGTSQFEALPLSSLKNSNVDGLRYVAAKKLFRRNKYSQALSQLSSIDAYSIFAPYVHLMRATIYSIIKKHQGALRSFEACIKSSEDRMSDTNGLEKKQLRVNRDYCTAGIARNSYGNKKNKQADLDYLDIEKSSYIWPEVLAEEAWNSFYQGKYNRALGKLVSYKAPVFDYIYNPEIEVLTALSYMKLCLYSDAKKTSENFYNTYLRNTRSLRLVIKRNQRKYKFFYNLMLNYEQKRSSDNPLLERMLKSISKELNYMQLKDGLLKITAELKKLREEKRNRFRTSVYNRLKDTLSSQRKLYGNYVKGRLINHYATTYRAFEGMSYIKLEVLAQRKAQLYNLNGKKKKRGDVKFIKRNKKQYYWDFIGEFWADELGDYVFALKSEC